MSLADHYDGPALRRLARIRQNHQRMQARVDAIAERLVELHRRPVEPEPEPEPEPAFSAGQLWALALFGSGLLVYAVGWLTR